MDYGYIERFKRLGFGIFVHFGLYSLVGKGEWHYSLGGIKPEEYNALAAKFNPHENWAQELVQTAKDAGAKYITLTTCHHDGFSLYDTRGLSDFDAPHFCGRDLVGEFVSACKSGGIVPFFYHTLLDWHNKDYENDFPAYIDYLVESVETLCTHYGKIGGLWFDGMWNKPAADWQQDRLYGAIRKLQPEAMIINNTGLDELGKTGHPEIDSVTFERGKPAAVDRTHKPVAGEVCEGITDHWGYTENDICTKSVRDLIETLIDCRKFDCNFLLNIGPKGDGKVLEGESACLRAIGKWIRANKNFIYSVKAADLNAENACVLTDGEWYYAVIKKVPMSAIANVARAEDFKRVKIDTDKKLKDAVWLDSGERVETFDDGVTFDAKPFDYGTSLGARVAKFKL